MTPQIVEQLRGENAKLKAEVARLRRQDAWFAEVARLRIAHLENGIRQLSDRGHAKLARRIIETPVDWLNVRAQEAQP